MAKLDSALSRRWPDAGPFASNLCRVVRQLQLRAYIPSLVALMSSTDAEVRLAAAQGLGSLHGTLEGAAVLRVALADEDARVRAAACRSLGSLDAVEGCAALLSATRDENPQVRTAAVQALVAIDNSVSLPRMREIVMEDASPSVVAYAVTGLACSGREEDLSLLMSLCGAEDDEVVKAAARALGHYAVHRATAALIGLLSHSRWDVRRAAAQSLAQRADHTALVPLQRVRELEADHLVKQALSAAVEATQVSIERDSASS